jgi:hypothetical protein
MRNLIKKILKEQEDHFEWTKDLDVNAAETEVKKDFVRAERDYDFGGEGLYQMLISAGVHDLEKLKEIGEYVYQQTDNTYTYAQDNYDYGCDGCCDDYVYEDEVSDREDTAREEGREERQEEIDELKGQIDELNSTIEELHNRITGGEE